MTAMTAPVNNPVKRSLFLSELERLLMASVNTTGIPEPMITNQLENTGDYLVYLSKLTKQRENHG